MTFFYPDVSHHNWPQSLVGASFVMMKATEGTSFVDERYDDYVADCARRGVMHGAYHFLHRDSPGIQAMHAFRVVGARTPLMLDVEWNTTTGGNATVATVLDFTRVYRKLGGTVHLVYLPEAYWRDVLGSPHLAPLTSQRLHIANARYTLYSDSGPGWNPYGGIIPAVWQYADRQVLNGKPVDYNAFRGTREAFLNMISGGSPVGMTMQDLAWQISNVPAPDGSRKLLTTAMGEWAKVIKGLQAQPGKVTTPEVMTVMSAGMPIGSLTPAPPVNEPTEDGEQ